MLYNLKVFVSVGAITGMAALSFFNTLLDWRENISVVAVNTVFSNISTLNLE